MSNTVYPIVSGSADDPAQINFCKLPELTQMCSVGAPLGQALRPFNMILGLCILCILLYFEQNKRSKAQFMFFWPQTLEQMFLQGTLVSFSGEWYLDKILLLGVLIAICVLLYLGFINASNRKYIF